MDAVGLAQAGVDRMIEKPEPDLATEPDDSIVKSLPNEALLTLSVGKASCFWGLPVHQEVPGGWRRGGIGWVLYVFREIAVNGPGHHVKPLAAPL